MTLSGALKLNGVDRCPRQASWLGPGQQAEQVVCPDLPFELATGGAARRWARGINHCSLLVLAVLPEVTARVGAEWFPSGSVPSNDLPVFYARHRRFRHAVVPYSLWRYVWGNER